jgi:hypothetical protein
MHDAVKLLWFVAWFQFFHWFDPSEPYFSAFVLYRFNVTEEVLLLSVYSWDVLFQVGVQGARTTRLAVVVAMTRRVCAFVRPRQRGVNVATTLRDLTNGRCVVPLPYPCSLTHCLGHALWVV